MVGFGDGFTSLVNLVIRAVTTPTPIPARFFQTSSQASKLRKFKTLPSDSLTGVKCRATSVAKKDKFSSTYAESTNGNGAEAKKSHEAIGEGDCLPDGHDPSKTVHHFVENLT